MNKFFLVATTLMMLNGCTKTDIEIVQSGTLDFNKTTTVGKALDNWQSCESKMWSQFETNSGVQVVEFDCVLKTTEYIKKIESLLNQQKKDESNGETPPPAAPLEGAYVQTQDAPSAEQPSNLALGFSAALDISAISMVFQFTINKDGTFQIHNTQQEFMWADNTIFSQPQQPVETLTEVYNDVRLYDPASLSILTAGRNAALFSILKSQSEKEK